MRIGKRIDDARRELALLGGGGSGDGPKKIDYGPTREKLGRVAEALAEGRDATSPEEQARNVASWRRPRDREALVARLRAIAARLGGDDQGGGGKS